MSRVRTAGDTALPRLALLATLAAGQTAPDPSVATAGLNAETCATGWSGRFIESAEERGIDADLKPSVSATGFQGPPTGVIAEDLDSDGDIDLLFWDAQEGLHLYANDGTGDFEQVSLPGAPDIGTDRLMRVVAAGDLDGDGSPEWAIGAPQAGAARVTAGKSREARGGSSRAGMEKPRGATAVGSRTARDSWRTRGVTGWGRRADAPGGGGPLDTTVAVGIRAGGSVLVADEQDLPIATTLGGAPDGVPDAVERVAGVDGHAQRAARDQRDE